MSVPSNIEIPCAHPVVSKENIKGSDEADYVCADCGRVFKSRQEWREAREKLLHATDTESED